MNASDMELSQASDGVELTVEEVVPGLSAADIDLCANHEEVDHLRDLSSNRCRFYQHPYFG